MLTIYLQFSYTLFIISSYNNIEREVTNMKLFKNNVKIINGNVDVNVIIINGNPYVIVAQNPSTIWISDGDRVIPLEYHHTSLCKGYVSTKSKGIVDGYSGKFGIGVTVKEHNFRSSRYCYISYYILNEEGLDDDIN